MPARGRWRARGPGAEGCCRLLALLCCWTGGRAGSSVHGLGWGHAPVISKSIHTSGFLGLVTFCSGAALAAAAPEVEAALQVWCGGGFAGCLPPDRGLACMRWAAHPSVVAACSVKLAAAAPLTEAWAASLAPSSSSLRSARAAKVFPPAAVRAAKLLPGFAGDLLVGLGIRSIYARRMQTAQASGSCARSLNTRSTTLRASQVQAPGCGKVIRPAAWRITSTPRSSMSFSSPPACRRR